MFDKKLLLSLLSNKPAGFIVLAKKMNIKRKDNKQFSAFINKLVRAGEVFQTRERDYFVPHFGKTIQGKIRLNMKGFAFMEDEDASIFISPNNVNNAMDNDLVEAKIFSDPSKEGDVQGIVSKIIERARDSFVGRVTKYHDHFEIIPNNPKIKGRFVFETDEGLKVDDEIKVKIIKYGWKPIIKLIKVLGHKNDVSIDILTEIEDANVPTEFSPEAEMAAKKLPQEIDPSGIPGRIDLRDRLLVTIDGDDTKDFDDAISVHEEDDGTFVLGVHIADVTHYVKEGDPIDADAKDRGTSIYLADRVIPMLPFELSNGICSLNPQVDRYAITAEMKIDRNGHTVSHKIFPSVIKSNFRLTYNEVNRFYENDFSWENDDLHQMLLDAKNLSEVIRKFKLSQGYIDFEIAEAKIVLNDQGKTVDIVPRDRGFSEMMIEDFMVRANECVATHAEKANMPFIYRVHDKPDLDRVANLQGVVKILGMDVQIPQSPIPSEFAKAINQIKETRFDDFMKIMMLRTMAKAEYSPENIGHFGLASKSYSHFTSPIRRYPDLMVHRMLRAYFFKENNDGAKKHFSAILPDIAEHSSFTEQRSTDLERKVADIKKAEFYEELVGKSFKGTIVSMNKFGFFVEFPNKVDGLVHVSTLVDGEYKMGTQGYSLDSGSRKFTVGDKVEATIVNVVKSEGKIDLVLSDLYEDWKAKEAKFERNRKPQKR